MFWRSRGKEKARDPPIFFCQSLVDLLSIGSHIRIPMITRLIPNQQELFAWPHLFSILDKDDGMFAICTRSRTYDELFLIQIKRPIIGLTFSFIVYGHGDRTILFPPRIASRIPPHQMTFIFHKDTSFTSSDLVCPFVEFFLYRLGFEPPEQGFFSDSLFRSSAN